MSNVNKTPQHPSSTTSTATSVNADHLQRSLSAEQNAGAAAALSSGSTASHSAADLNEQIQSVQGQLQAAQKSVDQLTGRLGQAQSSLEQNKKNLSGLSPRPPNSGSFGSPQDYQKALNKFNKENPDYGAQVSGLSQAVSSSQGLVDSLNDQLKQANGQVDGLQGQIQSLKAQLPAAQAHDAQAAQESQQDDSKSHKASTSQDPRVRRANQWQQNFSAHGSHAPSDLAGLGGSHEPTAHSSATSAAATSDGDEDGRKPGASGT